ncbi:MULTISPECIES: glycosyltransferase [unclassified Halomonas]|uniref:glycosyltransferase n=1 Tax=unclassified Halomonas TaxID=2609666 RepID=UPI0028862ED8|nr:MULTISPECIES: glycosyltransferase [unclassified Halomonas]MDT0500568.1 glycosyltransferase [Halomonas sp. PAR7]MDT0511536.1 glycosyltransferase [Halomonas sp. LES1]MDT0590176.1 glycosyltransferase [Halomonas sp. PAR8]
MDQKSDKYIIKKIDSILDQRLKRLEDDLLKDWTYRQILADKVFGDMEPLGGLTSWTVPPEMAWWLYRQVVEHRYRTVVELGSGFSTLVLGEALKTTGSGRLFSFEHDYDYYLKTRSMLEENGLEEIVHLLHAPLVVRTIGDENHLWYDLDEAELEKTFGGSKIDFLLVDGPPAATQPQARYPAYPVFAPYLHEHAVVVLDDGARADETATIKRWLGDEMQRHGLVVMNNMRHSPVLFKHGVAATVHEQEAGEVHVAKEPLEQTVNSDVSNRSRRETVDETALHRALEENAKLESRIDKLKLEMAELRRREAAVSNSLRFQLVDMIVKDMRQPQRWPGMPARLYRAVKEKRVQGKEGRVGRKPRNTLWSAWEVEKREGIEAAIAFAESSADARERPGIHLLRANRDMANDQAWLASVNAYIAQFDMAPVALKDAGKSRFFRLSTAPLATVESETKVSVIMPAYNAQETLEFSAFSILAQTWRNIELIIVNDASDDRTLEICQRLERCDNRVRVINNTSNVGPYVSKNLALRQASGDYITGHDADDWAHPQRIELQLEKVKGRKVSIAGMLRLNAEGRITRFNKRVANSYDGVLAGAFISAIFERTFLLEVLGGWIAVRFAGDSELIHRAERYLGGSIPRDFIPAMFCLDAPEGLTNHAEHGYSPERGLSEVRKAFRDAFKAWHASLSVDDLYLDPWQAFYPFPVPKPMRVPYEARQQNLAHSGLETCVTGHACIITDLRFPGGNASSTLAEYHQLKRQGFEVKMLHLPSNISAGKPIANRYREVLDDVVYFHSVDRVDAEFVIVRHPQVVCSRRFHCFAERVESDNVIIVVNNSIRRSTGESVYEAERFREAVTALPGDNVGMYAIGPRIRRELPQIGLPESMIGELLWTPTFDVKEYPFSPKPKITLPFVIGRHGRDSQEKWPDSRAELLDVYPDDDAYRVEILGGAKRAVQMLGRCPDNWVVHDFGALHPADYLASLDVFVYFPSENLVEAFGRTVVEAMLSGVPVILPRSFEETFGDLALYTAPSGVKAVMTRLAEDDEARVSFLTGVRSVVERRYSHEATESRLGYHRDGARAEGGTLPSGDLEEAVRRFKRWVETGEPK